MKCVSIAILRTAVCGLTAFAARPTLQLFNSLERNWRDGRALHSRRWGVKDIMAERGGFNPFCYFGISKLQIIKSLQCL